MPDCDENMALRYAKKIKPQAQMVTSSV